MIDRILVVCEGNICRSPMAAALLAKALPNVGVISAGTHAPVDRGADPAAIELMKQRSLDIGEHVTTPLTAAHLREAQLVLTMTRAQRERIEALYPFARGKVYRLAEHDHLDIVDPYRHGSFLFELALAQIEQGVSHWLHTVQRIS
jgi:protein-tyrosine phosphatase